MIEREDERLLWNYLDNHLDQEEQIKLLERLRSEPTLATYLDEINKVDRSLVNQNLSQMDEDLKARIMDRIQHIQKYTLDVENFSWKNLRFFAFFNLLLLGASLLYLFSISVPSTQNLSMLATISNILDQPIFQTFFIIIIGVLTLLVFDQYLKRRIHHGVSTPV